MKFKLLKKQNKYIVIFCIKEANTYNFIEYRSIKPNIKRIKYDKDNEFMIDIEHPSFRKRDTSYYCIDINAIQIHFKDLEEKDVVSSRVNKMIMSDQIIMQLAKATTTPIQQTYDWKTLIIGLIIGTLVGFILKIFIPI